MAYDQEQPPQAAAVRNLELAHDFGLFSDIMSKVSRSPHRGAGTAQRQQDEPLLGARDDPDAYNFVGNASEPTLGASSISGDAGLPWYRRPSPAWSVCLGQTG